MTHRLFGTDGVRGKAGHAPLDAATIRRLGAALVRVLPTRAGAARLVVGRDTRESGAVDRARVRLRRRLVRRRGDERRRHPDAGNRLPRARAPVRRRCRHLRLAQSVRGQRHQGVLGCRREVHRAARARRRGRRRRPGVGHAGGEAPGARGHRPVGRATWITSGRRSPSRSGSAGSTIAIDCANGATYGVAPALVRRPRVRCDAGRRASPTGATSTSTAARRTRSACRASVVDRGCALGVAFDGDGDRAIFVDQTGRVVDGDAVHAACAPAT